MSLLSSLLVVAVVCIALYVLAALVLPERFQ
ncbi:phage shock protein PspC (stress-responsive transcriptional regulator) [Nocardioides cavernae]|uniref:Phage shock protein PspC (Stress-responsive transcriptional regulator) n=1 Tax=Nocardioides cavernae TaxID=1921566 RepID=A0A7Y9H1H3_9ACTN|nr:phage shock protein PspC (stress-responsive transcriptional regulator) [Nocardioides cavernae]